MEKGWLLFVIFVFCINLVSPLLLEELNGEINAGETFVGEFEANLKNDLTKNDVKILEGRREVFFEKDILRYKNTTFIYVVFPKEGNFSLVVNDFLYYDNTTLKVGSINHSVSVGIAGSQVLTVTPGVISSYNLSILLKNIGSEALSVSVQGETYDIELNSSKRVNISPSGEFFYLDISSYKNFKVPVVYFNLSSEDEVPIINLTNITNESQIEEILFPFNLSISKIQANLTTNKTEVFYFSVRNNLNESISLKIDSNLKKIKYNKSLEIEPLESSEFTFEFFSENPGIFNDSIIFEFEEFSSELFLSFYVLENEEEFVELFKDIEQNLTCADVGGEICLINQECVGGSVRILNGFCCVGGECKGSDELYPAPKKNYLLGFLSVAAAIALGLIVYKKFKDVKSTSKF